MVSEADSSSGRSSEVRVALAVLILPWLGLALAAWTLWQEWVGPMDLILCASFYFLTMLGITLGFHRLFTHRSFQCSQPVALTLAVLGAMAAQGPVLHWTACHRKHHQFSDAEGDPHSPHLFGTGLLGIIKGWWHSHYSWMFKYRAGSYWKKVPDLIRNRALVAVDRKYFHWIALGFILPAVIGGAWSQSWLGALTGAIWGGLFRMLLVHHATWTINSICHLMGSRPHATDDHSRNNLFCAILTLGEGWHNNHHAFPTSARQGLRWLEIDVAYYVLLGLRMFGLAWDIRTPTTNKSGPQVSS